MNRKFLHIVFLLTISGFLSAQFITKVQTNQEENAIDVSGLLSAQSITNVKSKQEGNTIAVTYDLQCTGEAIISLYVSEDGGINFSGPLNGVRGDVGSGIRFGSNKKIVWDVTKDKAVFDGKNIIFRVKANLIHKFTDSRDGKTYKTFDIGNQTWMAENLNYSASSVSYCYENKQSNCDKYGRLYDWQTAQNVCPSGWRLPMKSDFETILTNVGGSGNNAYNALLKCGNTDFSAMLGGLNQVDDFQFIEKYGMWWSSSGSNAKMAWSLQMNSSNQNVGVRNNLMQLGLSVRCIKE
jgi:uncharacterized protein (TIGR02145 family)